MAIGLVGCALLRQPVLAIIALALVPLGHCASYGPFWSMPTQFFTGPAAAAGIALVTMIANVGSFAGPTLIGILKTRTVPTLPLSSCSVDLRLSRRFLH